MRIICHLGFSTGRKYKNQQCCTCLDGASKLAMLGITCSRSIGSPPTEGMIYTRQLLRRKMTSRQDLNDRLIKHCC